MLVNKNSSINSTYVDDAQSMYMEKV